MAKEQRTKRRRLTTLIVQAGIAGSVREATEMLAAGEICVGRYYGCCGWPVYSSGERIYSDAAQYGRTMHCEDRQIFHRSRCPKCSPSNLALTPQDVRFLRSLRISADDDSVELTKIVPRFRAERSSRIPHGLLTRVARRLKLHRSHVSRVAYGHRKSSKVLQAILAEVQRLELRALTPQDIRFLKSLRISPDDDSVEFTKTVPQFRAERSSRHARTKSTTPQLSRGSGISRGLLARVARRLKLHPSHVSRVARGHRKSGKVKALLVEVQRLEWRATR
jgi:hypothetical protein